MQPENFLTLSSTFKQVPYPPADRKNGDRCHGFTPLKGASEARIGAVPEVVDCPPLRVALLSVNASETPFFTIGCEKDLVEDGEWFMGGFVEFAFNYSDLVTNAASYFPVFFHFDRIAKDQDLPILIRFHWELAPVKFIDASGVIGYTATVWVRTGRGSSREIALDTWSGSVEGLAFFLANYPTHGDHLIYGPKR